MKNSNKAVILIVVWQVTLTRVLSEKFNVLKTSKISTINIRPFYPIPVFWETIKLIHLIKFTTHRELRIWEILSRVQRDTENYFIHQRVKKT